LPKIAGLEDEADRLFTLEEGRTYPPPSETFDSENLAQLRMAIEDYLDGGEAEQVRIWLKHIRRHFADFAREGATQLNAALDVERTLNAEGDFHHHVGYLVRKGSVLCEQGLDEMDQALEAELDARLVAALDVFRQGNDHICTALLMISDRKELLEEAVERFAPPEDVEES
jgi:hypothetical protein